MKKNIQSYLENIDGTFGIAVKSLSGDYIYLENERELFHAASIIKIPILLELFRQVDRGVLSLDNEVVLTSEQKIDGAGILFELHQGIVLTLKDLAVLMIVISDNTASNMLIDIVGQNNVNRLMDDLQMEESALRKKFMVQLADPSIINETTPYDIMILLEKLYTGEILSPRSTEAVLEILMRQQYNEKIPLFLPEETRIAHKTGEVSGVRHDAGIVLLEDNPYIICLFSKNLSDCIKADRVLAEISRDFFHFFQK